MEAGFLDRIGKLVGSMAWTWPTAMFFSAIIIMLLLMTVWELAQPTTERRGWLPMRTTRGDRLFIGLLGAAWIHIGWLMGSKTGARRLKAGVPADWKVGDKTSWEGEMRARTQYGQNEYTRVGN